MVLIMFFILLLNAVAIALTYYCLSNLDKKEKLIFIAVGIAVSYVLTSIVYWISTRGVEVKQVSEMAKNILTFLFVPINSIIVLPIFAKSYNRYTMNRIKFEHLRNRGILLGIILLIVLIMECSYFKEIQNGVIATIEKNKVTDTIGTSEAQISGNVVSDGTMTNSTSGEASGNTITNTQVETEIGNGIVSVTNGVSENAGNTIVQNENSIAPNTGIQSGNNTTERSSSVTENIMY